jgi:hypothetical protein
MVLADGPCACVMACTAVRTVSIDPASAGDRRATTAAVAAATAAASGTGRTSSGRRAQLPAQLPLAVCLGYQLIVLTQNIATAAAAAGYRAQRAAATARGQSRPRWAAGNGRARQQGGARGRERGGGGGQLVVRRV